MDEYEGVSLSQSLPQICTHQVVATSSVNDGAYMAVLDDEENLE
jgi:hypothetical protein